VDSARRGQGVSGGRRRCLAGSALGSAVAGAYAADNARDDFLRSQQEAAYTQFFDYEKALYEAEEAYVHCLEKSPLEAPRNPDGFPGLPTGGLALAKDVYKAHDAWDRAYTRVRLFGSSGVNESARKIYYAHLVSALG
jgi:hypothetical protein